MQPVAHLKRLDDFLARPIWRTCLVFVIALGLAFALYGRSLNNPTLFDDHFFRVIYDAPEQWRFGLTPRQLNFATIYYLEHWLGTGLYYQRIFNVLIHAINILLVFILSRTLLDWVLGDQATKHTALFLCSLMASLFFLAHPISVYDVAYLNQRSTALATLSSLLMLLTFWRGLRLNSYFYLLATTPLYLGALLCKEHAIMVPAICACAAILHDGRLTRRRFWEMVPLFLIYGATAAYVVILPEGTHIIGAAPENFADVMLTKLGTLYPAFDISHKMIYSIETQGTMFFKYWSLWLVPNPYAMSIDMRAPFAVSVLSSFTVGFAAYLSYGLIAALLLLRASSRNLRFLGFSLLCPWLLFFTEFSSLRLQEIFVLYRSYLWFSFLAPLLALFFYSLKGQWRLGLCLLLTVILTLGALNRLNTFQSEINVWSDAKRLASQIHDKRPGVERIYYNLGTVLLQNHQYLPAIDNLEASIAYIPGPELDADAIYNLAMAYRRVGDHYNSLRLFERLADIGYPMTYEGWWMMGDSYRKIGEEDKAVYAFYRACQLGDTVVCKQLAGMGGTEK